MNKITIKVFFSTFIILIIASIIPNAIYYMINGESPEGYSEDRPYMFIMFMSVLFLILVFNFIMNRIIYKRINELNKATSEVMKGNYDVRIEEKSNDEITDVIKNFNTMTRELKANEYQSKEFIRNFSHELKTPLAAIKGYSDLLTKDGISEEEKIEYSSIISNEAKRLSDLSKNMLLVSLVDSKVILQKNDNYNLAEQIRNVIQLTQLSWEEKNIEFVLEISDIKISSNKELLYQVWLNLISNAIKFAPSNSKIEIDLVLNIDHIIFTITNDGFISTENQEKIFDLFYVLDKAKDNNSSGVGLTLTKKIISKLNGNIAVNSLDSKIEFKVELPI